MSNASVLQKILKTSQRLRIVDYIFCVVLGVGGWLIGQKVRPYCRPFSWNDQSIAYSYGGKGTFPSWTLTLISILPVLVYVLVEVLFALQRQRIGRRYETTLCSREMEITGEGRVAREEGSVRRLRGFVPSRDNAESAEDLERVTVGNVRWWACIETVNHWILAQAFSVALCIFVVDLTKLYAGRLRPDFLARLAREGYSKASQNVNWCDVAREGRLSFPSGHSGISFASIVTFVMYCMGRLQVFHFGSLWRCILSLIPLFLPVIVAVSRTRDNRHHFSDILAGSMIGSCCAILSVNLLFHSLEKTGMLSPRQAEVASKREDSESIDHGTVV